MIDPKEPFDADNDNLVPSKANSDDLNYLILFHIKNLFGNAIADHLQRYMKKHNIDFANIESNHRIVKEIIHDLFGEYSFMLEKEIVRMIFIAKGLELDQNDDLELACIKLKVDKKCDMHKAYLFEELLDRNKYCKICNKNIYRISSLASLCNECYRLQEELVTNILNELF
jgi:hypothetical protein